MSAVAARVLPTARQQPGHVVYLPLLRALHGYTVIDLGQTEPFIRPDNNTPSISGPTTSGVVAITLKRDARYHSYRWQNGSSAELALPPGFTDSTVLGINQNGQIVGFATAPNNGNTIQDAILWDTNGQFVDLGPRRANAINNTTAVLLETTNSAAIWRHERATKLTTPSAYSDSWAAAINNADQVVGWATLQKPPADHAALWDNTGQFHDLGTLGGANSGASDINDSGVIVGTSTISNSLYHHAFVWQAGVMTALALPAPYVSSTASAINSHGQIVGYVQKADFTFSAALWRNEALIIFNDQIDPGNGWQIEEAVDINDAGQIVGFGHLRGELHLVLLTPTI
jgi:probable HAF family extracellular repeat protein